jgi:hypothetical protein
MATWVWVLIILAVALLLLGCYVYYCAEKGAEKGMSDYQKYQKANDMPELKVDRKI